MGGDTGRGRGRGNPDGSLETNTFPKQHKPTCMVCEAVVQNAGPCGLIHTCARNEPSTVRVQKSKTFLHQPSLTPPPSSFSHLMNGTPNLPVTSLPAIPCTQILPGLHGPAQETSSPFFFLKPPKYLLCCVLPPPYHGYLRAQLLSPLQWGHWDVLVFTCPCCLAHSRPSGCWLA